MENYTITLPDGRTVLEEFESDRAAIACAVELNHGCSDNVSVSRITDAGESIPTRMCPASDTEPNTRNRPRAAT